MWLFEKIKMLSEKNCVYCKLLKALLKENGLDYEEISEARQQIRATEYLC